MNNCTVFVGSDTIQCSAAPECLQPVTARLIYRKIYIDISSYLIATSKHKSIPQYTALQIILCNTYFLPICIYQ